MFASAHHTYLETQITTATPQKLRLMLLDGALRFAHQTADQWQRGEWDSALESLIRCREIVAELLSGVQPDESSLSRQVTGLYVYLLAALTEAQQTRDEHQLAAVVRVLEAERETWRQVCDQVGDRPVAPPTSVAFTPREELAPAFVAQATAFSIDA